MAARLAGKRALVTAAGQGIGRAVAARLAEEGAAVLATDIDAAKLSGLPCEAARLDVTDAGEVARAVQAARPDILFNGAGFVHHGTVLEATEDEWEAAMELNVRSMFRTIRAALPGMLDRGGGSIVNMASAASSVIGAPARCVYGTSKAAVIGLTKSVAKDFVGRGIRCNAICPGTVQSPSLDARIEAMGAQMEGGAAAARAAFVARQPMGRLGEAGEIAALGAYLASDESAFMTGQAVVIDGGWSG
jgi:2-keto-3-deoxy-L-fuconate dehydrogenase